MLFSRNMYYWRNLSPRERLEVLARRKALGCPWHSPPHTHGGGRFLLTAACFEHKNIIGKSVSRLVKFEEKLLTNIQSCFEIRTWVILPNHYHVLGSCEDISIAIKSLGRVHGGMSYQWNGEEKTRGRQVWCKAVETRIKSDRHYFAAVNYVHHNPVRHRWVKKWQEWPFSGAHEYLAAFPRDEVVRRWNEYDISEMGKGWDLED